MKRRRGESGQSLIVALVFVMGFTILLTAALGFASTSLLANRQTAANIHQGEAAEAGAELGIQQVRGGAAAPFGAPLPTATATLTQAVNGESVAVTVTQLDATTISVSGPATLALNTAGDYQVLLANGTTVLPFGATWSVTPSSNTTLDQSGRFQASVIVCYTLRAQLGNVGATKQVAVGGATCP